MSIFSRPDLCVVLKTTLHHYLNLKIFIKCSQCVDYFLPGGPIDENRSCGQCATSSGHE